MYSQKKRQADGWTGGWTDRKIIIYPNTESFKSRIIIGTIPFASYTNRQTDKQTDKHFVQKDRQMDGQTDNDLHKYRVSQIYNLAQDHLQVTQTDRQTIIYTNTWSTKSRT